MPFLHMAGDDNSAAGAAFAEAVRESGAASSVPGAVLSRLRASLLSRVLVASPRILTTSRSICPLCFRGLYQSSLDAPRDPRAACWIFGEPAAVQLTHVPRWCKHCFVSHSVTTESGHVRQARRFTRYWCGFLEQPVIGDLRAFEKVVDVGFPHEDFWLTCKSFGVTISWLRRWRYRLLIHRSSVMGEAALFHMMHGPDVVARARRNLSEAWVRHILWKRAHDATPEIREDLIRRILTSPLEKLIASAWGWYGPMMADRRIHQFRASGDRDDILAIDGNAKMHRRTCGMPFAEVVFCAELNKNLLRGCSDRPSGKGTLCAKHSRAVDASQSPAFADVAKHRLRRALHDKSDFAHLEVQLVGFSNRWQPASTVDASKLEAYFATRADAKIQGRRKRRMLLRSQGVLAKRRRKGTSYIASWSSTGPRASSECGTHKETDAHITAAARTAGFLTAVSASGIVVDVDELIGAESMSQRYRFAAILASRIPSLKIIVHDDACHLRLMAESQKQQTPIAARLAANISYIVDSYHASGHVGHWCSEHCMPHLDVNAALLDGFPRNICETMNSELSPLGHTLHHMGRWMCQLAVHEMVDVLNMKTLQRVRKTQAIAKKKCARAQEASTALASLMSPE
jgi:hypothetical protein